MAKDRIPLNHDGEMHGEPFLASVDYIRARQDKSKMPWPDDEVQRQSRREQRNVQETTPVSDSVDAREEIRLQSEPQRTRGRSQQPPQPSQEPQAPQRQSREVEPVQEPAQDEEPSHKEVEDEAVRHVVRKLREKGVPERFIHQNMAEIRERARRELLDQQ